MKVVLRSIVVLVITATAFAQNEVISPNENLVVEGVPPIPASLAETVGRYTNFRGASLRSWDPVNREMLISTRFADTSQIHLVKMPGGARQHLPCGCPIPVDTKETTVRRIYGELVRAWPRK